MAFALTFPPSPICSSGSSTPSGRNVRPFNLKYALTSRSVRTVRNVGETLLGGEALGVAAPRWLMAATFFSMLAASRRKAASCALSEAPAWGYTTLYQLPTDCLRVVQVNDTWVVPGLADYTSGPDSEPYKITGRRIETDIGAPLKLRYIKRVTDPAQFDAAFVEVFANDLADQVCEALTQSNTKREATRAVLRQSLLEAVRSNAIELPPEAIPDDSWILSRL